MDDDVVSLLESINSELSSIKLWMPTETDYTSALVGLESQLERANGLLESILEELRAGREQ